LIPDEQLLDALRQDYQAMLAAQMFYGDTLAFDVIVERLQGLELEINQMMSTPS
jgi:hypothetical protein